MRILKKHAPQLRWVISFSDACQCGDGTIYRASGFLLTAIKENKQLYQLPTVDNLDTEPLVKAGLVEEEILALRSWLRSITHKGQPPCVHKMSVEGGHRPSALLKLVKTIMRKVTNGKTSAQTLFKLMGGTPIIGHQLRYIYFLDPSYRKNLTVAEIPFSQIKEKGASMYKGVRMTEE